MKEKYFYFVFFCSATDDAQIIALQNDVQNKRDKIQISDSLILLKKR